MNELKIKEVPDKFFYLNKDGTFNKNIVENKPLENSQYWASKTQEIGLVMLVSMATLIIILLVETDVFNVFWGLLWG